MLNTLRKQLEEVVAEQDLALKEGNRGYAEELEMEIIDLTAQLERLEEF